MLPLLLPLLLSAPLPDQDPAAGLSGAIESAAGVASVHDGALPVLAYRARRVELPPGYLGEVAPGNRIYAVPRSGYLHPLFGPEGEELTLDWSVDHPHHRGLYWAWPEVQWGGRTGDLHALQQVFSRPVGEAELRAAGGAVEVRAENLWRWEDGTPVVLERVVITARPLDASGARAVDLELRFEALVEGLSLARRGTDLYGGLNLRLAPVDGLALDHHAPAADEPPQAWSSATGTWRGARRPATLAVLEHPSNPGYPGDWITYPELPWFQPAFPPAGTRQALERGRPLTLRYRLRVRPGAPDPAGLAAACDAFAATPPVLPAVRAGEER